MTSVYIGIVQAERVGAIFTEHLGKHTGRGVVRIESVQVKPGWHRLTVWEQPANQHIVFISSGGAMTQPLYEDTLSLRFIAHRYGLLSEGEMN